MSRDFSLFEAFARDLGKIYSSLFLCSTRGCQESKQMVDRQQGKSDLFYHVVGASDFSSGQAGVYGTECYGIVFI